MRSYMGCRKSGLQIVGAVEWLKCRSGHVLEAADVKRSGETRRVLRMWRLLENGRSDMMCELHDALCRKESGTALHRLDDGTRLR